MHALRAWVKRRYVQLATPFHFSDHMFASVKWVHANKEPFNQRTYSDPDAMVLRYVYREHTMHAGQICPIQDVMDGLWLGVVT